MAKAGNLNIDLSANTARLKSDFTKATAVVKGYRRQAKRSLDTVKKAIFSLKGAVVSLVGAAGLGALIAVGAATADSLAKTSDKLGITTEALAGMRHAAELTGVSQNTLDMALQRMTRRLAEAAQGAGEAKSAIAELGLDAKKLAAQSPDKSFSDIAEAMGGMANQGDKVRLAMKFFDSEGVALVNTLALQKDGLKAAAEEAGIFGLALSRVDAAKVEASKDAMTRVKAIIKGAATTLAVQLSPYLEKATMLFVTMAKESGGFGKVATKAIDSVIYGIAKVADVVNGLKVAWQAIKVIVLGFSAAVMKTIDGIIGGFMKLADMIPGVNLTGPMKALTAESDATTKALINAELKLHEMMMTKPPSSGIIAAFEDVKMAAEAAALKVAETKVASGETTTQMATDLMYNEAHLIKMGEALKTLETERATEARVALAKKEASDKRAIVGGMMSNLATLMGAGSKRLFRIGKVAAISGAIIKGYESVLNSYAAGTKIGGPLLGAAFAATAGIATAVQIQGIKSQSYGGGGGVSTGGSPGVPSAAIPTPGDFLNSDQTPRSDRSSDVRMVVEGVSGADPHSEAMRNFIESFVETAKDMGPIGSVVFSGT